MAGYRLVEIPKGELGSYGYREYRNLQCIYGTGIAEPRFSTIQNNL